MSGDEESAGFPTAPPSFGHPEPEIPAKVTVPGGFRPPGPPVAPWWAPQVPDQSEATAEPLPGVLVAGPGVPVVDTRRAVPREPLVRQVSLAETTDPDGFPAITNDTVVDLARPQSPPPNPTLVDSVLLSWQPLETERPPSDPEDAPAPEAPTPIQETWQPRATEQSPAAAATAAPGVRWESGEEILEEPSLSATAAPSPEQPLGPQLPK